MLLSNWSLAILIINIVLGAGAHAMCVHVEFCTFDQTTNKQEAFVHSCLFCESSGASRVPQPFRINGMNNKYAFFVEAVYWYFGVYIQEIVDISASHDMGFFFLYQYDFDFLYSW